MNNIPTTGIIVTTNIGREVPLLSQNWQKTPEILLVLAMMKMGIRRTGSQPVGSGRAMVGRGIHEHQAPHRSALAVLHGRRSLCLCVDNQATNGIGPVLTERSLECGWRPCRPVRLLRGSRRKEQI